MAKLNLQDVSGRKKGWHSWSGLSGLIITYELERVGYDVTIIIEADSIGVRVIL
jgi:hypothetical protein